MKRTHGPQLVVALDQLSFTQAEKAVDELSGAGVRWFKVGLELFTLAGPEFVKKLKKKSLNVFLDLKLYDIPNTVQQTVKAAADLGVDLMTVHCSGGRVMLDAAQKAAQGTSLDLVGVTVLTSMSDLDVSEVSIAWHGAQERVPRLSVAKRLCEFAFESGLSGIVCSVPDLQSGAFHGIASAQGNTEPLFVTPGIRIASSAKGATDDQKSVATPETAVGAGATHLVVGRPILQPAGMSPSQAAEYFLKTIQMSHH